MILAPRQIRCRKKPEAPPNLLDQKLFSGFDYHLHRIQGSGKQRTFRQPIHNLRE